MLPTRFPDRAEITEVLAEAEGAEPGQTLAAERRVAGRVMARREMGKLTFVDLVDRSGRIQLIVEQAIDLDLGDIVGALGRPGRSRRGEPSLVTSNGELLAKIRRPLPDTFHGVTDTETRYRQRYLDLLTNEETRADFQLRTRMGAAIRRYLDGNGFLEVETPVLQPRYGGAFAEPFVTHYNALDADYYLRIATELYLKRLIVGGLERVYELGKDFRNEGVSFKHNPEFTMVEWYEAYADYTDEMRRVEEMVDAVAKACGYRGDIDLSPPWPRVTLRDAIFEKTGVDVLAHRDRDALVAAIESSDRVDLPTEDRTWPQLVDDLLSKYVEPEISAPQFIIDYPVELSPFAKAHRSEPGLVERFEAFVDRMEFANAFTELNDPDDQRARFEAQVRYAAQGDEETQPMDDAFLSALEHGMPPTGGVGVGIDRLVMVMTGKRSIREVVLFPAMRD